MADTLYVDTSALLAALLEGDDALLDALRSAPRRVTSALTWAEAPRALVRAVKNGRITAAQQRLLLQRVREFLSRCDLVALEPSVLERAGEPFPVELVGTLDALHLASALRYDAAAAPLSAIATRDVRMRDNAEALGFGLVPASL